MNFLSRESPDLQFRIKPRSRDMANPTRASWKALKKVVRYLTGRKSMVWEYPWQDEP